MSAFTKTFPTYRSRYLPAMTPAQIGALPDKEWAPVIIGTGAIEQHGPHLPVAVDALIGQAMISMALDRLPAGASCYVAPPITIGKSNEHTGYPGTLTISKKTLRSLLLASARQIHAWGFKSLAVLNSHGGNLAVVGYTLREIHAKYGLRAEFISANVDLDMPAQEKAYGYHAEEFETSVLLSLKGKYVRPERAVCEYSGQLGDPGELRAERSTGTFSWVTRDLSKSGVMGNATAGTREKGDRFLPQLAQGVAEAIARACEEMKACNAVPA
jgi:creatinine amidohydrolase